MKVDSWAVPSDGRVAVELIFLPRIDAQSSLVRPAKPTIPQAPRAWPDKT